MQGEGGEGRIAFLEAKRLPTYMWEQQEVYEMSRNIQNS